MKLSTVTTMYRSESFLIEFYDKLIGAIKDITDEYEIILVNDGSPDNSLKVALELQEKDNNIKIVDLSKNFGHHKAMVAGLSESIGEHVFLVDCDLEEDPNVLVEYYNRLKENPENDVIYGIQQSRKGNLFEKLSGYVFYKLFNFLSYQEIPANSSLSRLMTRRYVDSLLQHCEKELFLPGLWAITGYNQLSIPIIKEDKKESSYTLTKKIALFVNAITSFSVKPLSLIFYTGMFISFLSLMAVIYLVYSRLFCNIEVDGWTSLIVSIWFLGGLMIFFMGIIGIYISKIFIEIKQRPLIVTRKIYEKNNS